MYVNCNNLHKKWLGYTISFVTFAQKFRTSTRRLHPLQENGLSTPVRSSSRYRSQSGQEVPLYSPFRIETPGRSTGRVARRSNIRTVWVLDSNKIASLAMHWIGLDWKWFYQVWSLNLLLPQCKGVFCYVLLLEVLLHSPLRAVWDLQSQPDSGVVYGCFVVVMQLIPTGSPEGFHYCTNWLSAHSCVQGKPVGIHTYLCIFISVLHGQSQGEVTGTWRCWCGGGGKWQVCNQKIIVCPPLACSSSHTLKINLPWPWWTFDVTVYFCILCQYLLVHHLPAPWRWQPCCLFWVMFLLLYALPACSPHTLNMKLLQPTCHVWPTS